MRSIIQIIGNCCSSCHQTHEAIEKAAAEIGGNIEVEHIEDIVKILQMGVLQTPAILIDDKLVSSGKHYTVEQAKQLILENQ